MQVSALSQPTLEHATAAAGRRRKKATLTPIDAVAAPALLLTSAVPLVLSLFSGADRLVRGFELAGYCVVRGPDLSLGQDIRTFTPPDGVFVGVIGGPPCQDFSRCIHAAWPIWWLMENVTGGTHIQIEGYTVQRFNLASGFGYQRCWNRAIQFGCRDGGRLMLLPHAIDLPVEWAIATAISARLDHTEPVT